VVIRGRKSKDRHHNNQKIEDTIVVIRGRKSKDRHHNNQKKKEQKDKQGFTKHYTEN